MIRRWETERREGVAAVRGVIVALALEAAVAVVVVVGHLFGALAAYAAAAVLVLAAYLRVFRGQA